MPKVKFVNEKKEIDVPMGANLRQVGRDNGIDMHHEALGKKLGWDWPLGTLEMVGISLPESIQKIPDRIMQVANCQGNGLCGTCHVHVKKGMENCSERTLIEKVKLGIAAFAIGHEDEVRLACQVKVNGDIEVVTRPTANLSGETFWLQKVGGPKGGEEE